MSWASSSSSWGLRGVWLSNFRELSGRELLLFELYRNVSIFYRGEKWKSLTLRLANTFCDCVASALECIKEVGVITVEVGEEVVGAAWYPATHLRPL